MARPETLAEAARLMVICNACRYCEGHCAVFPAMERRIEFSGPDLTYLANLCHNCGACYHHCQYAPPHPFAVNVPKVFTELRTQTYQDHVWPRSLAPLLRSNGLAAGLIVAVSVLAFILATVILVPGATWLGVHAGSGAFYTVIPHAVMVAIFVAVSLWVLAALVIGFRRFWQAIGEKPSDMAAPSPLRQAIVDALRLRYLEGGTSDGCTYPEEAPSQARRWFHHLTFYGFLLCFAATTTATVYAYGFGWQAPYAFLSVPVLLGTLGGLGLLVGPAGLLWLKRRADAEVYGEAGRGMDMAFLILLLLTSVTGLLLLALRTTPAMGMLLAIHLGVVLGLFLTMPYGKFVHAVYRLAALLKYAVETTRPPTHQITES